MNNMCKTCPRFSAGYIPAEGETFYTAHYCAGCDNDAYTGCIRRPWHPLASVLNLVYNVNTEQWEDNKNGNMKA